LLLALAAASAPTQSTASSSSGRRRTRSPSGGVLEITDANFDRLTAAGSPPLIFSVGAAWCPHCVALLPALEELARELAPRGVRVGKVDGPANRALMARLAIEGFPALFLVSEGGAACWRYPSRGARTAAAIGEFALAGHRRAPPLPFHRSPVSRLGRAAGAVLSLPAAAAAFYESLREKGFSNFALLAGALAAPVAAGGAVICALDAAHTRRAREEAALLWGGGRAHGHAD